MMPKDSDNLQIWVLCTHFGDRIFNSFSAFLNEKVSFQRIWLVVDFPFASQDHVARVGAPDQMTQWLPVFSFCKSLHKRNQFFWRYFCHVRISLHQIILILQLYVNYLLLHNLVFSQFFFAGEKPPAHCLAGRWRNEHLC